MVRWCRLLLLSGLLVLHSCATSNALKTAAISERNIDNLARLNLGMSRAQVLRIMPNPFEYETLQLSEDKYDVLFYITNPTVLGQTRMVPFNLTPLIFKDKILVAIGYGYYNYLKDKITESKKAPPPPSDSEVSMSCVKKQEEEIPKELADPPPPSTPKKDVKINEEDERMLQDEDDQNFDFW